METAVHILHICDVYSTFGSLFKCSLIYVSSVHGKTKPWFILPFLNFASPQYSKDK